MAPSRQTKSRTRAREPGLAEFSQFLKTYLRAWPVLIACLIGPLNKYLRLVPMYASEEDLATGIVFVYGFLFAAALLHYRPALLQQRTLARVLPAALIVLSIAFLLWYMVLIQASIRSETDLARRLGVRFDQLASEQILARTSLANIPNGTTLLACYLASFFAAETGLVMLALNELANRPRSSAMKRTRAKP